MYVSTIYKVYSLNKGVKSHFCRAHRDFYVDAYCASLADEFDSEVLYRKVDERDDFDSSSDNYKWETSEFFPCYLSGGECQEIQISINTKSDFSTIVNEDYAPHDGFSSMDSPEHELFF